MSTGQFKTTISMNGSVDKESITQRTADGFVSADPELPAGVAGSLTTRTDADEGIVTAVGHGLTTGDKADVYWTGGVRYGMACTVDGNAVTLAGGGTESDDFPAEDTAVIISKQVSVAHAFDGDNAVMISALCDQRCHLDYQDSGGSSLFPRELPSQNEAFTWASDTGMDCPITGNPVATVKASNGTTTPARLYLDALVDATV